MAAWGVLPLLSYIISVAACPICYNIDIARRQDKDFISSIPGFNGSYWDYTVSSKDAALSEEAGCQFCQVLSKIFRHVVKKYEKDFDLAQGIASIAIPFNPSMDEQFYIKFSYVATRKNTTLMQTISTTYYLTVIQKPQEGPLHNLPEGGYIPSNPLNELCFRKIKRWIQDCTTTHLSRGCRSKHIHDPGYAPVRLIAVGTGTAMSRVVETRGLAAEYTALSYCWGNARIPVTQKANLEDRQRCLHWTVLPKVFQDAIILTRAIGIKYIWIDAICIVQDNYADISAQLGQMGQVYREAYLVISADSASNANDRLFKMRQSQLSLRAKPRIKSSNGAEVLFHKRIDHEWLGGRTVASRNWPLARRGWTLQERFLATRIIHISDNEVVWECNDRIRCECKYMDRTSRVSEELSWTSLRSRYIQSLEVGVTEATRAECWCLIVREYSGRLSSSDLDRLPAISGLAGQFGNLGIGEYRAGLWTKHALRMMSWNRSPNGSGRRPSEYLAPSWSWASMIGLIDWIFTDYWDFSQTVPADDWRFVAQVVHIACYPRGPDPFGSVCGGYLTISSPTLTVAVRSSKENGQELDLHMRHTLILDINAPGQTTELLGVRHVKCLFLEGRAPQDTPAIVVKSGSLDFGVFTRVGRLFVQEREKLPELTTEVLTIY